MAWAALTHATAKGDASATTGAIDTTGANFLVAVTAYAGAVTGFSFTDSKSNTWTALTERTAGAAGRERIYYCVPTSVGSGHTFTLSGATLFGSLCVASFSGGKASSPFDAESGAGATPVSTKQPGSITPAQNSELLIAGLAFSPTGTISIDGGYTITDQQDAGDDIGSALAYKIQTYKAASNPTLTKGGSAGQMIAALASFKAAVVLQDSGMFFGC